jgi:hypothetical protein
MKYLLYWCVLWCNPLFAQTTFLVTDGEGIPIANVNLIQHGKLLGTTDKEGMFLIPSLAVKDSIIFSSEKGYYPFLYLASQQKQGEIQEIELAEKSQELQRLEELGSTDAVPDFDRGDQFIYTSVEVSAIFPGGEAQLNRWIAKNLRIPDSYKSQKKSSCILQCVVEQSGQLRDIQLYQGISDCQACNLEAIRLLKSSPNWIPAKQNGKNVGSYVKVVVEFER